MIYDLNTYIGRERYQKRCAQLLEKRGVVEMTEKKEKRTLPQNSYLHLIISWFALEYGETAEYVKREYFKKLCNRDLFVYEKEDRILGRVRQLKSSRDLNTSEMTTAIERFRDWSNKEAGIYLPAACEPDYLREIEFKVKSNQRYL